MSSRQTRKLKRMQQRESENDPKKAKLLIPKTRTKMITINQLDLDCLANIFSYLPPVDRMGMKTVCKKWEEAVGMSWHNVKKLDTENLPIFIKKSKSTLYKLLKNFFQYLTHLTIDYQYSWMADILKNNCQNIVYFDVKLFCEHWSPIRGVILSMSKLKYLKITATSLEAQGVFTQLTDYLPEDIEEIHFMQFDFPDDTLPNAPALDKFTNLRCFTLESFRLTTSTIESLLLNKNSLNYLDLNRCHFPWEYPKIFTELIHLEHLNLDDVKELNVDIVAEIAHTCQQLKYFVYSEKELVSTPFEYVEAYPVERTNLLELKYLVNIEHLDVSANEEWEGDVDFMPDVVNNCKKLKHLNVGGGQDFLNLDIEAITKLKNVEFLDLSSTGIDLKSFDNIASNCLELREIIINFRDLPEIALEKLINLKKLEKLDLNLCLNVNDNLLSKIANNCKNLVDLSLAGCKNLTEDSLLQVGKLQHLKKLDIDRIKNVPNAMFDTLHKLEYLSCSNCSRITDEGIIKVIDNCLNLSLLNVKGTGITVHTLVHAAKRKFSFKILNIIIDNFLQYEDSNLNGESSSYLKITKYSRNF